MRKVLDFLRSLVLGDPRRLARDSQRATWMAAEPELRQFASELRPERGQETVIFGHVRFRDGSRRSVGLPLERITATHLGISGASGSGKTTVALDLHEQLLAFPQIRHVGVDPKGDFEVGMREQRLPLLARRLGDDFAARVRYLRLFAGGLAPHLRLTAREPGVSIEVQSLSLATAMAEASGMELTPPAVNAFTKLARLAIELNEPLTTLVTWIARPEVFALAARRSSDDRLRHYALVEFPREHRGMLRALQARVEGVLLLPSVRSALEAPTCVSFTQVIEDNHLLVDLSHPPGGEEAAVRVLGGPIIGRLTRAILNRPVRPDSPHVVFTIDELQEVLTHHEAASFGRLAALARSRRVSLITINQQRVQLGPKLSEILRVNCGVEMLFRCHATDAEALSHVLPVPPGIERPSEERRALVRKMVSLPRRSFLLWIKDAAVPAHFVRARKVDAERLRQAVAALPDDVRESLGQWPDESVSARGHGATLTIPQLAPPPESPSEPDMDADPDSLFPRLG